MGISTSLVLIAVGAILKWAVSASTSGANLQTAGVVLIAVRAVELEQERHVVEAEAVMAGQRHVDVADDDGACVGELKGGRERCGCVRCSHAGTISLTGR